MCLAVLFSDAGSTPDNLFKCGHALNGFVENNELCHLAVSTGRKKLRCRCNNRVRTGHRDEIIKFGLAIYIRTGNAHTVVRVFLNHIGVVVDKGNSHAFCMVFGSAEHNSLLHPVCAFQILRNFPCNLVNAVFEDDVVIIIPVIVDTVFNHIAVDVGLPMIRFSSVSDIGRDIDNLKRSKEAVFDALFQTVNVNRVSEVIYVRYFFAFFWCGLHADLGSGRKILQYLSPVAVFFGTATMTLIHDNEVKIFRRYLLKVFFIVLSYHLMVEGEVYLMGSNLVQTLLVGKFHFVDGLFKRCEVL